MALTARMQEFERKPASLSWGIVPACFLGVDGCSRTPPPSGTFAVLVVGDFLETTQFSYSPVSVRHTFLGDFAAANAE
jgi:hypothetical protein